MSNHTPELLKYGHQGTQWLWIGDDFRNQPIALVPWDTEDARPNAREHAERLIACWNACAGIPTEALQPGSIGALITEAQECDDYFDSRADADQPTGTSYPIGNEEMTRLTEIRAALAPFLKGDSDED